MMERYIQALREYALKDPTVLLGGESVLGILYECHNENHPYENDQIKVDFHVLYEKMNGMPLREMDKIIYRTAFRAGSGRSENTGFTERLPSVHAAEMPLIGTTCGTALAVGSV